MKAHRLKVNIPSDHRLEIAVRLPKDFPSGPAEVIVLAAPGEPLPSEAAVSSLSTLAEIRSLALTREEEQILDGLAEFQREHPFRLASLDDR